MKQSMKRFYGTLATVAVVSGLTGAFAISVVQRNQNRQLVSQEVQEALYGEPAPADPKLMTLSTSPVMPSQPVDLTEAAEKGCQAVVYIKVVIGGETRTIEYRDPFEDFFGDFFGRGRGGTQRRQVQTPKQEGAGSGVLISSDGYIVTNNHVVQQANEITVTLNDNREFTAKVIGTDPDTDLALIKIDGTGLPTLVIGDSDALKVGEWVLAVGNPFNLTSTVTAGIVSAKARNLGANNKGIESFIQTDAAINRGNSGGALINARGELVGINAMLYSETGSYTGYGFAIPVSIMKKVVADLKEYGTVQRALLGVSGMTLHDYIDAQKHKDEKFKADFGTNEGVYVAEVSADGAAADAGLKEGDIIVSVDGKKVTKMSELQEATTKYRPGDKATIGYIRNKNEKMTTITFRNAKGTTKVMKSLSMDVLGAEFKEVPEGLRKNLGIQGGVMVKSVKNGKFRDAGIEKDLIIVKINGQNIKTVADVETAFKQAQQTDDQTMWILAVTQDGTKVSKAVQLGE
ncbi:MAG: Do family serine endopeptidase [Bacteroidaceae bacterium]|nr:Do family serine endopeptidase [Bacteroidaceae bacterium]